MTLQLSWNHEPELAQTHAVRAQGGAQKLVAYAVERLRDLCLAAGFDDATGPNVAKFRELLSPWSDLPLVRPTDWRSDISDDHTPIEFSVAMTEGEAEVRALIEAPSDAPTVAGHRASALELLERLERQFGADLTRFHQLRDLFLPADMQGGFAAWISAVYSSRGAPQYKVYMNPQAQGVSRAHLLVEEAMNRLGLSYSGLAKAALRRGPLLDEIKYFALDLTPGKEARVKVYVHHHHATAYDVEVAASNSDNYVSGQASEFIVAMTGRDGVLEARSPFTCHAFNGGAHERPAMTTVYAPVCAYAQDDAVVHARVCEYLYRHGQEPRLYDQILRGFARRPLTSGTGLHSWIALRTRGDERRLTAYLALEAQRVYAPNSIPAPTADRLHYETLDAALDQLSKLSFDHHPLVMRMRSHGDIGSLVIANLYEGVSRRFTDWVEALEWRATNREVQAALGTCHGLGIIMDRPDEVMGEKLLPACKLARELDYTCNVADWREGVGTLMAAQVAVHQLLREIVSIQAQQGHELHELRMIHGQEPFDLIRAISRDTQGVDAVVRGAVILHTALWTMLSDIYEICFGSARSYH